MKVTVLNNQTLFDLAIRYCGSPIAAFAIARANEMSVSAIINAGEEINIPLQLNADVVDYFNRKNHQPATGWNPVRNGAQPKQEGISFWAINDDFIITTQFTSAP